MSILTIVVSTCTARQTGMGWGIIIGICLCCWGDNWVDQYWLIHTSQKVSVKAPHHGSHLLLLLPLHITSIRMRLLKIRNCFVILVTTVTESSKLWGPIILATAFLTGVSLPYLLFPGFFHAIPPLVMVPNSFLIFHLVLNRDFLLQSTILLHPKPLAQSLLLRCVLASFLLFLCQFLKMMERDLIQVSLLPNLPLISKIFESFIIDSLTKHLDILWPFVHSRQLLTSSLLSVSVFTICWMQVERLRLLHLWWCWPNPKYLGIFFCRKVHRKLFCWSNSGISLGLTCFY